MQARAFDVVQRKKRINIFRARGGWIFKHYFEEQETFRDLAEYYDRDGYRFVLKTLGERNKAMKILERRGFEVALVESTRGYTVKLSRYSRYAFLLKNSVAHFETPEWRIFLMKDQAAVEEALRQGASLVEVDVRF
ncbi:Uncharacterised protein [uncultured archaeon]|nr:Uncharacterised protein [uncultured archaeon]